MCSEGTEAAKGLFAIKQWSLHCLGVLLEDNAETCERGGTRQQAAAGAGHLRPQEAQQWWWQLKSDPLQHDGLTAAAVVAIADRTDGDK